MDNTNNINIPKFALSFGLIAGLVRVLIDYLPKILDLSAFTYYATFFVGFVFEIFVIYYVLKTFKLKNGILLFKQTLQIGITIMFVLGLIYCTMSYIYDTYIDSEYTVRKTLEILEKYNPDQMESFEIQMKHAEQNKSILGIFTFTLYFVFIGVFISLILGSFLKSENSNS